LQSKNAEYTTRKERKSDKEIKFNSRILKENLTDRFKIAKIQGENLRKLKRDLFLLRAKDNCFYHLAHKVPSAYDFRVLH